MLKRFISIRLPYPPSINHYYKEGRICLSKNKKFYRKKYLSEEGVNYRKVVQLICFSNKLTKLFGKLKLIGFAFPPDKRIRDNDNIRKALFDSLQYANLFDNDSQIYDDRIIRIYDNNFKNSVFVKLIEIRNDYANKFKSIFGNAT